MSYILEALRKVEQQREHLPAHGLSSRRRYYSAIDARFWSRPWVLVIAAIAGASLSGAVVAYLAVDYDAQQTSVQQQEPALAAPHPAVAAPSVTASADDHRQTGIPAVAKPANGATPALQPVRPAALRMPGPRYQPQATIAVQPQDKANVKQQGLAAVTENEQVQEKKPADTVPAPEPATPPETKQPASPEDEAETEVASVHPSPHGVKTPPLPAAVQERALNTLPKSADSLDMIPPPKAVEVQPFRPNDVIRPPAARRYSPSGNSSMGEPPMLSTLPSQFQSMVPKLVINAQVYSAVPAQRFVVINMKRYNEGQSTSEGVNVISIRQQDIVFSFQGQRFRQGR
jgi:general secretion pathway protein B